MPYVFQLFAALLETNPSNTLPDHFKDLIQPILMPVLWESKGNAPALVRLLGTILPRGAADIARNNQIEPILGIFQKLISLRATEVQAFELLESIVAAFPM